jgi:hypothetical protein
MNMKKKKKLRSKILIFAVSLALFGTSYQNIDGFEASESKISNIASDRKSSKEVNSFTQSDEFFGKLFFKTVENLNINCRESALVNYQSQKLDSPDGKQSTFFDVTMQRPGNASRIGKHCSSRGRQTLIRAMVIEKAGKIFKLNTSNLGYQNLTKNYFAINPISFSPDSRFLVTRLDFLATSTDYFRIYAIFDFQNNYRYLKLTPCKDDQFGGRYHNFKSNTEVVFKCDAESQSSYLEIINLQTLSIRRATINSLKLPSHPISYGSISLQFSIKP